MTAAKPQTVAALLEQHLKARTELLPASRKKLRVIFSRFERFLGRPAQFSDLSSATFGRYRTWLERYPSSKEFSERLLRRVWRLAHGLGLVDVGPPPRRPLREFYDRHFVPDKLAQSTIHVRRSHVVPLNRFCRFLKREAKLSDLSNEQLAKFVEWLNQSGYSDDARQRSRRMLRAVWRHAYSLGLTDAVPPDQLKREFSTAGPLMDFVRRYAMERDLSVSSRRQHEYAIRHFGRFLGRPATLADFKADTVNAWLTRIIRKG